MEEWRFPPRYDAEYLPSAGARYWFPVRETMPPGDRERAIVERLKEVTHYAWDHAPFYRRKWEQAGFHPDQLRSLEDFDREARPVACEVAFRAQLRRAPNDPDAVADGRRQRHPAVPVVLRQRILDRHQRVGVDESGVELRHLLGGAVLLLEAVTRSGGEEFGGGDVERQRDLGAGLEAAHVFGDIAENPPGVAEVELDAVWRLGHCGVVHPIGPLRLRHQDLGVGEHLVAVLGLQPVDVVGMEM